MPVRRRPFGVAAPAATAAIVVAGLCLAAGLSGAARERSPAGESRRPAPADPGAPPAATPVASATAASAEARAAALDRQLEALLNVASVAGREGPGREAVRGLLGGLPVREDASGNLVLRVGSGAPRRLVVCPLGEPGFVVTQIQADGYLRVAPAGAAAPQGALWEQAHEGQVVFVAGARGALPAAVALPSIHLQGGRTDPAARPFAIRDAFLDVGAEDAREAAEMGVRLLDPVALIRRPVRLANGLIAGPSARVKGACLAAVAAARAAGDLQGSRLSADREAVAARAAGEGSVVFAWTVLDLINAEGLRNLLRTEGPFDEAIDLGWGFGWEREREGGQARPAAAPAREGAGGAPRPGSGPIFAGALPPVLAKASGLQAAAFAAPAVAAGAIDWGPARVVHLGLPALYPGTPVEAVSTGDIERLAEDLQLAVGAPVPVGGSGLVPGASAGTPAPQGAVAGSPAPHAEAAAVLAALTERYGVHGHEGEVRAEVVRRLPPWARPTTDEAGNLSVTFGRPAPGSVPLLFLAHLDEVGFTVREVLPDGRLRLATTGGVFPTVWEAQAALVHRETGRGGPVAGVFEPREDWASAERRALPGDLLVSVGASGREEVAALGLGVGSTVTMPKRMLRLGRHRAVARAMDDRVGSTALLLALRRIDPTRIGRQVTFAWTTGEEIGLEGATAMARRAAPPLRVYAVDTFVSSDSPLESRGMAFAPLGRGAVLRAMDGAFYAPRDLMDEVLALGGKLRIPLQVGRTGGATDGVPFLARGASMLPLSWPGRYSHSPVEVADLRDLESLTRLVVALTEAGARAARRAGD